jgi:hypothetical protein
LVAFPSFWPADFFAWFLPGLGFTTLKLF